MITKQFLQKLSPSKNAHVVSRHFLPEQRTTNWYRRRHGEFLANKRSRKNRGSFGGTKRYSELFSGLRHCSATKASVFSRRLFGEQFTRNFLFAALTCSQQRAYNSSLPSHTSNANNSSCTVAEDPKCPFQVITSSSSEGNTSLKRCARGPPKFGA